ncbi:hypothetical protein ERJ75_000762100 [Trypanosoma vivax]|uniref:Uncharacterized protein n=1 Tax=Trypanosoma vivax (strain Y486) TaxID=1055687 RepID=G0TV86_TRYVY|nr:hypothetical protein TRVL_02621 [Trypanosoma vivax]KAH8613992.1 hypothetical protein ERJ75_000762100 [Trypanosoma vivax]CCC47852.1 conserved hypothetical protein [Trypanosoma vivax Y486]
MDATSPGEINSVSVDRAFVLSLFHGFCKAVPDDVRRLATHNDADALQYLFAVRPRLTSFGHRQRSSLRHPAVSMAAKRYYNSLRAAIKDDASRRSQSFSRQVPGEGSFAGSESLCRTEKVDASVTALLGANNISLEQLNRHNWPLLEMCHKRVLQRSSICPVALGNILSYEPLNKIITRYWERITSPIGVHKSGSFMSSMGSAPLSPGSGQSHQEMYMTSAQYAYLHLRVAGILLPRGALEAEIIESTIADLKLDAKMPRKVFLDSSADLKHQYSSLQEAIESLIDVEAYLSRISPTTPSSAANFDSSAVSPITASNLKLPSAVPFPASLHSSVQALPALTFSQFWRSMVELADNWTSSAHPSEYAIFLTELYYEVFEHNLDEGEAAVKSAQEAACTSSLESSEYGSTFGDICITEHLFEEFNKAMESLKCDIRARMQSPHECDTDSAAAVATLGRYEEGIALTEGAWDSIPLEEGDAAVDMLKPFSNRESAAELGKTNVEGEATGSDEGEEVSVKGSETRMKKMERQHWGENFLVSSSEGAEDASGGAGPCAVGDRFSGSAGHRLEGEELVESARSSKIKAELTAHATTISQSEGSGATSSHKETGEIPLETSERAVDPIERRRLRKEREAALRREKMMKTEKPTYDEGDEEHVNRRGDGLYSSDSRPKRKGYMQPRARDSVRGWGADRRSNSEHDDLIGTWQRKTRSYRKFEMQFARQREVRPARQRRYASESEMSLDSSFNSSASSQYESPVYSVADSELTPRELEKRNAQRTRRRMQWEREHQIRKQLRILQYGNRFDGQSVSLPPVHGRPRATMNEINEHRSVIRQRLLEAGISMDLSFLSDDDVCDLIEGRLEGGLYERLLHAGDGVLRSYKLGDVVRMFVGSKQSKGMGTATFPVLTMLDTLRKKSRFGGRETAYMRYLQEKRERLKYSLQEKLRASEKEAEQAEQAELVSSKSGSESKSTQQFQPESSVSTVHSVPNFPARPLVPFLTLQFEGDSRNRTSDTFVVCPTTQPRVPRRPTLRPPFLLQGLPPDTQPHLAISVRGLSRLSSVDSFIESERGGDDQVMMHQHSQSRMNTFYRQLLVDRPIRGRAPLAAPTSLLGGTYHQLPIVQGEHERPWRVQRRQRNEGSSDDAPLLPRYAPVKLFSLTTKTTLTEALQESLQCYVNDKTYLDVVRGNSPR